MKLTLIACALAALPAAVAAQYGGSLQPQPQSTPAPAQCSANRQANVDAVQRAVNQMESRLPQGGNVSSPLRGTQYLLWYWKGYRQIVDRYKACFPAAEVASSYAEVDRQYQATMTTCRSIAANPGECRPIAP